MTEGAARALPDQAALTAPAAIRQPHTTRRDTMHDAALDAVHQAAGTGDLWEQYEPEALEGGKPRAWRRYELTTVDDQELPRLKGKLITNDENGDGKPDGEVVVMAAVVSGTRALEEAVVEHWKARGVFVEVFVDGERRY